MNNVEKMDDCTVRIEKENHSSVGVLNWFKSQGQISDSSC